MISNLFYMSGRALLNAQYAVSTHGNNVTNANTPGYVRRSVVMENTPGIDSPEGPLGTGATVQGLIRHLDKYLQQQQMEANGGNSMWSTAQSRLSSIEALFTNKSGKGLDAVVDEFWNAWSGLTSNPDNLAKRSTLLQHSKTMLTLLGTIRSGLETELSNLNKAISSDVDEANSLMKSLADVNRKLAADSGNNDLKDQQNRLITELSQKLDIKVTGSGTSKLVVMTKQGQTLVSGTEHFSLKVHGPEVTPNLTTSSSFDGKLYFEGASGHELKVEFTSGGPADGSAGAAKYRVSLDGGKTWVTNPDGTPKEFTAAGRDKPVTVDGVKIWFGSATNPAATPGTNISTGDSFNVVAKQSIHWHRTTSDSVNITPLTSEPDGRGNRLSGGSLAGLAMTRDFSVRTYLDRLERFSKELIWRVNHQHSQGAGLTKLSTVLSDNKVSDPSVPLAQSDLAYASKLQSGGMSFAVYNKANGSFIEKKQVDFSSINPPGIASFDPAQHSLNDVATAINASFPGQMTASVANGQLSIKAADGTKQFHFAGDTTGVTAAMGLNTFFSGSGLSDIALASAVSADPNRVNTGHVNGAGEVNPSDKTIAQAIFNLSKNKVTFGTPNGAEVKQSLTEYLHSISGLVGQHTQRAKNSAVVAKTLKARLDTEQKSKGGVNIDEEYTRILQWNKNFQAASKLIQTANKMFDTILSLKS